MIKEIQAEYKCPKCGLETISKREIVIDKYLKTIEIPCPDKCPCRNRRLTMTNLKIVEK